MTINQKKMNHTDKKSTLAWAAKALKEHLLLARLEGTEQLELPIAEQKSPREIRSKSAARPYNSLEEIRQQLEACCCCKLGATRKNLVFGEGDPQAELVFVGEGPGADEDEQGRPFVGRAGKLLDDIIKAMKLKREEVYICNLVKCRPPGNRTPESDEVATCLPYLLAQLEIIRPRFIVTLGAPATQTLLKTKEPINKLRGRFHSYGQALLMPTFHPAYLLRSPGEKIKTWQDVQMVMEKLGKK